MVFTKRLRDGVRRGDITCSVRIWTRPHVKVGNRYPMEDGFIEIDSIEPIGMPDITPALARESGFLGVLDLLQSVAKDRLRLDQWALHQEQSRLTLTARVLAVAQHLL